MTEAGVTTFFEREKEKNEFHWEKKNETKEQSDSTTGHSWLGKTRTHTHKKHKPVKSSNIPRKPMDVRVRSYKHVSHLKNVHSLAG
jgi:hypothetical protein